CGGWGGRERGSASGGDGNGDGRAADARKERLNDHKNTPPSPLIRPMEPRDRAGECKPAFLQTADFIGQTDVGESQLIYIKRGARRVLIRAPLGVQLTRAFFAGRAQGAEYSMRLSTAKVSPTAWPRRFKPPVIAALSSDRLAW